MTKSVLIVEDYQSLNELYQDAFVKAGFEVAATIDATEALEKVKEHTFDVIILDMLMLGLSGLDFLKVYANQKGSKAKIVALSNIDSKHIVDKARALGVTRYIQKSRYTPVQLVDYVQKLLAQ